MKTPSATSSANGKVKTKNSKQALLVELPAPMTLAELLAGVTEQNKHGEVGLGIAVGKEMLCDDFESKGIG